MSSGLGRPWSLRMSSKTWRMVMAGLAVSATVSFAQVPAAADAEWRLVEINGKPAAEGTTLQLAQDALSGQGPCNRYSALLTTTNGALTVGEIASTRMMCIESMEAETEFFETLQGAKGFQTTDSGGLDVIGADGKVVARFTR